MTAAPELTESARRVVWRPNPGQQTAALAHGADEVLAGGGAGGGKSQLLLAGPLRYVHHPSFRAMLFRRSFPELEQSLIDVSWKIYPALGARYVGHKHYWRFPSGARVSFSHLEHERDVEQWQSAEFQFIGFDELPTFLESQYRFMFSRLRSADGLPLEMRATANPDPGWVRDRFAPWVDRRDVYTGPRVESGETLFYTTDPDTGQESICDPLTPHAMSRSFVRMMLSDNPLLEKSDPGYVARLKSLDPVLRARLLGGDWGAEYAPGKVFQRQWFEIVDAVPLHADRVRWWDRAATPKKDDNNPDWTVGLLYARGGDGLFYIEDVVRERLPPAEVKRLIVQTAMLDHARYQHVGGVQVCLPCDPGAAGVYEVNDLVRALAAVPVQVFHETGSKVVRATPVSAQGEAGNVKLKRAAWNASLLEELQQFPTVGKKDDQVDALSGAHMAIAGWHALTSQATDSGSRESAALGGF